jgi:mannose-6-phosphate isomerase-like protein (cupin superfamily)
MVCKFNEAPRRKIDETLSIVDLFSIPNKEFDFVVGELSGFHGTFVNPKSQKCYYIIEGVATVKIDDEMYEASKGDFIYVDKGKKHSIEGNVIFAILCLPSYDFDSEMVVD